MVGSFLKPQAAIFNSFLNDRSKRLKKFRDLATTLQTKKRKTLQRLCKRAVSVMIKWRVDGNVNQIFSPERGTSRLSFVGHREKLNRYSVNASERESLGSRNRNIQPAIGREIGRSVAERGKRHIRDIIMPGRSCVPIYNRMISR